MSKLNYDIYPAEAKSKFDFLKLNNEAFPAEAKQKWQNSEIVKAIHRSQHTQRNYDLSKTIPIEDLMANHIPMLEYADFDIEAKFKEVAVQGFYKFIKDEQDFAGEPITLKRAA